MLERIVASDEMKQAVLFATEQFALTCAQQDRQLDALRKFVGFMFLDLYEKQREKQE